MDHDGSERTTGIGIKQEVHFALRPCIADANNDSNEIMTLDFGFPRSQITPGPFCNAKSLPSGSKLTLPVTARFGISPIDHMALGITLSELFKTVEKRAEGVRKKIPG